MREGKSTHICHYVSAHCLVCSSFATEHAGHLMAVVCFMPVVCACQPIRSHSQYFALVAVRCYPVYCTSSVEILIKAIEQVALDNQDSNNPYSVITCGHSRASFCF